MIWFWSFPSYHLWWVGRHRDEGEEGGEEEPVWRGGEEIICKQEAEGSIEDEEAIN